MLVREEGMGHKPSLEERLTAEEILLYWSLFSPTQRQAFILERLWSDAEVEGLQAGGGRQSSTGDTMFARFAGIFHAFAALRKRVDTALEEDRPTEAETWLYGAQCDSLPTLLDKATEPDESDPVLAYLVLLCAKQLRHHVTREHKEFYRENRAVAARLDERLGRLEQVRATLALDGDDAEQFLDWYERSFVRTIAPLEEADA